MIKRFLFILLISFSTLPVLCQEYGFEWINYNQHYYKIPVGRENIYKLTYNDLVNAGVPVGSVDPRKIQIFHRGKEQAIIVEGELDARLDPQDYLLFYADKNDGTLDKRLYSPQEAQPHLYYNLYSDTTAYFLTWKLTGSNGKRMPTFKETNTTGIPVEEAHYPLIRQVRSDNYFPGRTFDTYTQYSQFDIGEGWTGVGIQENQSRQYSFSGINSSVNSVGQPTLNVFLQGRSEVLHRAEISVGKDATSLRIVGTQDFENYSSSIFSTTLNWADISASGNLLVQVKALGPNGNDMLSMSYMEIIYPQATDQQNAQLKKYRLRENSSGKLYLEIRNIPAGTIFFDITDKDNARRIGYDFSGSEARMVVSGTHVNRTIIAVSEFETPAIKMVNFKRYDTEDAEFVVISHPILMAAAGDHQDAVKAYAAYRNSTEGGGYDTLVADITQLYDQFNYGEHSPLAIFDFVRWLKASSSPKFLFFIGEGLEIIYNYNRKPGSTNFRDLVPTAGLPASDIIYSAGIDDFAYEPSIPTGRLTASTPQQVINYLEKVKVKESLPYDGLWRKRVLHLSGGIRDSELVQFRFFMDGFAKIAEAPYLGGDVNTIQKNSRTTSEFINIADEVNRGVNLVTFFGHSAPSVTDIDIGFVTNETLGYHNKDKYPVFLINGCNVGQFFLDNLLFGEDWVMAADRGAIAFIAHSAFGYPFEMRNYTSTFYNVGYGDEEFIEKRLGKIQQETIRRLSDTDPDPSEVALYQQMMLLGDPATLLFGAQRPDYDLVEGSTFVTSFDGAPVTALSDSFAINVIARNYGKALPDSIEVSIVRAIDNGITAAVDTIYDAILFQDTLQLVIKSGNVEGFGNNTFTITIDPNNKLEEYAESNNTLVFNYFLQLNATRNLLPYEFATIDQSIEEIVVQATNMLSTTRTFQIELDTSAHFDSPFLQSISRNERLLTRWKPDYLNIDTVTYYLRSRFNDVLPGEVEEWFTSSFTRIPEGTTGWSQRTPEQLGSNQFSDLLFDPKTGGFAFEREVLPVTIRALGSLNPDDSTGVSVLLDNTEYQIENQYRCRDNTLNFIAFNKETVIPYAPLYNLRLCGRQPHVINSFQSNQMLTGSGNDIEALVNSIGEGDSVVLFTIGDPQFSNWDPIVRTHLESLGIAASSWTELTNGEPVVIKGMKGAAPGSALIIKTNETPASAQEIIAEMTFTGISSSGTITTPLIGPANSWGSFNYNALLDNNDEVTITIDGYTLQGEREQLVQTLNSSENLSFLDAAQYPYLRIKAHLKDNISLTPAQLKAWYVEYEPSAEGILLPQAFDQKQELQEGDSLDVAFSFYNLSPWTFSDSLYVLYSLKNNQTSSEETKVATIKAPEPGDTIHFSTKFPTIGKAGENDFFINVNPAIIPEQYYENNQLTGADFLKVSTDNASPLLDVRFDGEHIFNRDIVSPNPLISIILKDENPYLLRKDTAGIQLFLKRECDGCDFERIAFSSEKVTTRADTEKREFIVAYEAGPLEDGIYTLRVQATDVSGNTAGDGPYEIQFEVINESMVTNFYPYPNPFSSSVRFIFTLTGNELPDQLLVRILTISGRVIKEISLEEFGLLRIGNNVSQYAWDGRDEFGDQLANGVYLYKVIIKKGGKEVGHRASAGDELFKNGYGKLYLLR